MAHATTASASSQTHANVDARLKNLKKNILPDYPLRLTQATDNSNARQGAGNCKYCYQNKDNCFCYAHHTFLSREEMTTYSDKASSFDNALPPKPLSSKQPATPASLQFTGTASRSGKKTISLGEYSKKRMQDGGSGAGRSSTPKDAPSPAEANLSKEQPTKSKPSQSNTHSLSDSLGGHPENDRPTKKLKTSNSASLLLQDSPVHKAAANASSKNNQLPRSPSKRPPTNHDEPPSNADRKQSVAKPQTSKKDAANSRQRSPKPEHVKHRRSPSPPDRPRERPPKKEEREPRSKTERAAAKDHARLPVLPKMLSPLPDELNRLVDEYERKHPDLLKDKDVDLSMDEEPPRRTKKAEKGLEKAPSHTSSRSSNRPDSDARPTKADRKVDRLEAGERDSRSQGQSPRIGFKVPAPAAAKRPPADILAKQRRAEKDAGRLMVRLDYGRHNVDRFLDIWESPVDQSKCAKCVALREDNYLTDQTSEKGISRDKSPLPTRVSVNTLKAAPGVKNALNGKISTPNRRLTSNSEKPRSEEQGSASRRGGAQQNDRDSTDVGENDMLKADGEEFLDLGIKLKHKADAALGVKSSAEDPNLNHALVYACHCVIAYFLSFGLEDEVRRRENRPSNPESWKSVLAYIEFLLSSRLKANPAIHGLLYQMGAVCSERVSSFEQQRLLGIPLTDPSRVTESNSKEFLETVRRSRNDLIRILRTNHDWWKLGHQRLPWSTVQADFPKTWAKHSSQVVKKPQIVPGQYLTSYYLPLYSGSSAFEAASFAWMITQEWATKAQLSLDSGLSLTWPKKESRNV